MQRYAGLRLEKTITSFISTVGEVLRAGDYHTDSEGTEFEGGEGLKGGCPGLKHEAFP